MNLYTFLSIGYDLLDKIWLSEKGRNPREVIEKLLPDKKCKVLDMCCGTFTNGLSIARKNPNNLVVGLDRSKPMLREGKRKADRGKLKNVKLVCRDATKTGIKDSAFDYVIIGLVLHECNPDLWDGILGEAHRILKEDGRLIILEWEKPAGKKQRIKYAPLYIAELLNNPKYFKVFFEADKGDFFKNYRFEIEKHISCNYTMVLSLKKETCYDRAERR